MLSLYFGLDVFSLFEARVPAVDTQLHLRQLSKRTLRQILGTLALNWQLHLAENTTTTYYLAEFTVQYLALYPAPAFSSQGGIHRSLCFLHVSNVIRVEKLYVQNSICYLECNTTHGGGIKRFHQSVSVNELRV